MACKSSTNSKGSVKFNGDEKENSDDIPLAKIVDVKPMVTDNSGTAGNEPSNLDVKKNKDESVAPKIPPPLPPSLSQEGQKLVEQLKACAKSCIKGKFFTPEVNEILLG